MKTWEWATGFAALGDRSSIDRIFIAGLDRRASLKRVCARWRCTGFFELLPPNWFQDYYGTRVQAYVRQALVAAVQPPDSSGTKAFRLMARGYLPRNPQVFSQRCVGFMLVGEDYLENVNRHQDTVASFLAFNRVARQIARDVKKGDQLEVTAWMRGNTWPPEPSEKRLETTFEVESFRFAGALPRVTKTK